MEHVVIRPDRSLFFPSVERFRLSLSNVINNNDGTAPRTITIDMSRVSQIDHTSLKVLNRQKLAAISPMNNNNTKPVNVFFLIRFQMLKAMLSSWDKSGERYSFVNVSTDVEKGMLSILPEGISVLRSGAAADADPGESGEEARQGEAAALLYVTTVSKDAHR